MRKSEANGKAYHFISTETFVEMNQQNDFLESALVHQNWYGTSKSFIESRLKSGKHIIMDIDVQGAKQILSKIDAVTIFILPPSRKVWLNRLNNRGTESAEDLKIRLKTAEKEIAEIGDFQYLVINDELDSAVKNIEEIIRVEEKKIKRYSKINF
jgi:guanylate kinase